MSFPEIKFDAKDKCWNMPGKTYIAEYLMPLIEEAAKRGECTMIFQNVPGHNHVVEYAFTKLTDINHLRNIYGTETKCGTISVGCPTSRTFYTNHTFTVPSHKEISQAFIQLGGYVVPHCDNKYFILNFSKFLKNESKAVSVDLAIGGSSVTMDSKGNKTKTVWQADSTAPQASSSQIEAKDSTINDFFYSAALLALKERRDTEIHFLHAAPGQVLCIKPPSEEFLSFTIDLNLLIDQRKAIGYEVTYRHGPNKETLIVMTFPLTSVQKMLLNYETKINICFKTFC